MFLPACLFKVLSVSILVIFLRGWAILVIVAIIILVCVTMMITTVCYKVEAVDHQHIMECGFLSWLTLAGLGGTNLSPVLRLVSTLTVTITYSLMLGIILAICNMSPNSVYVPSTGLSWADLDLVKDPLYLNLILGCTIGLGWISFLVDIILAWCKSHDWLSYNWGPLSKLVNWFVDRNEGGESGFWDRAVLLQGLKQMDTGTPI